MNIWLWVCQILLAITFVYSGFSKATRSPEDLVKIGQTGVEGLPRWLVRFIGLAELAGASGVIAPFLLQIAPILTPAAAAGLGLIMILAAPIHFRRREFGNMVGNLVILAACVFVFVGRL